MIKIEHWFVQVTELEPETESEAQSNKILLSQARAKYQFSF